MKLTFALTAMLFLCSCFNLKYRKVEPVEQIFSSLPNCENLPSFIRKNWYKHRTGNHYYCTSNFKENLIPNFFDCLKDLDYDQVEQIFGASFEKDDIIMFYYIGEGCEKPLRENCEMLIFVCSSNKKVHSVSFQGANSLK